MQSKMLKVINSSDQLFVSRTVTNPPDMVPREAKKLNNGTLSGPPSPVLEESRKIVQLKMNKHKSLQSYSKVSQKSQQEHWKFEPNELFSENSYDDEIQQEDKE